MEMLKEGEFYVRVSYEADNSCLIYEEITNGFQCRFWNQIGISTGIMFLEIEDGFIIPGDKKRVLAYTINPENAKKMISTSLVRWGSATCYLGTLSL